MSLTINTNLSSFMAQSSLKSSTSSLNQAIERMSTGFKINHAKDNAAGYSIANSMSSKLSSYEVATDNTSYGLELISTSISNLDLITSHLQRIRDLAEQASNGTYGVESLTALQSEVEARMNEVNRIISNTEYNGIGLFSDTTNTNTVTTFASSKDIVVDESKRVVNQTTFQSGETYYLTTSEDLVKLQDLVNSGVDTTNVTFNLANDINMRGVSYKGIGKDSKNAFKGIFNGNNHIISNLTINLPITNCVGLFGYFVDGIIDSVGLENIDITGRDFVGGLVGAAYGSIINSYSTGSVSGNQYVGGLIGGQHGDSIINSYSTCGVSGDRYVGGLVGGQEGGSIIKSYSIGKVSGAGAYGALVGYVNASPIINGYYDKEKSGLLVGVGSGGGYSGTVTGLTTAELKNLIDNGTLPKYDYGIQGGITIGEGREFILQVGIDSCVYSTIKFDMMFEFDLSVDLTTQAGALQSITNIDSALSSINSKQTELGAAENKLMSVLDALSINIENLTSSLSTIRDADIAEESSEYIRNQILQQASATLLSTANQNPSIALQLL